MAGIYLHIPFCLTRCSYCDFFSTTAGEPDGKFVAALKRELAQQRGFLAGQTVQTVYFGGGTPSLLRPEAVGEVLETIGALFPLHAGEITLEANPDDLTGEYLRRIRQAPVNRLSIGIQSFDDGLLRFMGRRHTAAQAAEAVGRARRAGFGNLSIDLIYGIPGLDEGTWERTLGQAVALAPEHISAYHLTIEPGTPLGRSGLQPVAEEQSERHYTLLCEKLDAAGYDHYEISNFALPGRFSRHNSSYWSGEAYLGVGPSAHSYDGRRLRRWNAQTLAEYLEEPRYRSETLSDDDLHNEYLMTSLRTAQGVDRGELSARFGPEALRDFEAGVARWFAEGVMARRGDRYAVAPAHFLVSDAVITSLFR